MMAGSVAGQRLSSPISMTNLLSPADYVDAPRAPADRRYAYGDEQDQFADLNFMISRIS